MNYLSYVPILCYAKILECVKRKKTIKINFNTSYRQVDKFHYIFSSQLSEIVRNKAYLFYT